MIGQSEMKHPPASPSPSPFDGYNQVRCSGCDWVITVAPREIEFSCPRCKLSQMLPQELMPPPSPQPEPEPEPILPPVRATLAVEGLNLTKVQLPCALCNVMLNLPDGLERFSCSQCGVNLGVDLSEPQESMRTFFAYTTQSTVKGTCSKGPMSSINHSQQAQSGSNQPQGQVRQSGSSQPQGQLASSPSQDQQEQPQNGSVGNWKRGRQRKRCADVLNSADGSVHKKRIGQLSTQGDNLSGSSQPQSHLVQSCSSQSQPQPSQSSPNQPQPQFSQSDPSPPQPHQVQSCSRQPQPQLQLKQDETDQPQIGSFGKRRARGPTRCDDLWNMPDDKQIDVPVNKECQPVGNPALQLRNFLGTIARNGKLLPLTYDDWRAIPTENKESIWPMVTSRFNIDLNLKRWVMMSLAKKWREWKGYLKAVHYTPHDSAEKEPICCDRRVDPVQWQHLVQHWNSERQKVRSSRNKANRAKQKMLHCAGTKSFARLGEEERLRKLDGKEPTRAEIFMLTRTRRDGRAVDEVAASVIARLKEQESQQGESSQRDIVNDVFSQVLGADKHSLVRTYGLDPSPSNILGYPRSHAECLKMAAEAKQATAEEVSKMREELQDMQLRYDQMEAKMTQMLKAVELQIPYQFASSEPLGNKEAPNIDSVPDVSLPRGVLSSASQGVLSPKTPVMKKGKTANTSTDEQSSEKQRQTRKRRGQKELIRHSPRLSAHLTLSSREP